MAHSIVTWLNTPDTWEVSELDLTTFEFKHIIKSSSKMKILSDVGGTSTWVDLEITGMPTAAQFKEYGMDNIENITEEQWGQLQRPIEVLSWTDIEESTGEAATGVEIEYEHYGFVIPKLELTVPEYTLADNLERPLKLLTYTDGVQAPEVKTEYDMVGVGTRIMKRGE